MEKIKYEAIVREEKLEDVKALFKSEVHEIEQFYHCMGCGK